MTKKEIEEIKQYIAENIGEKISVDELAKKYYLAPMTLYGEFKRQTGETLGGYINNLKMSKAMEYLKSGISCSKTALLLGYDSYGNFNLTFTKAFGISPGKFVEGLAKNEANHKKAPERKCGDGCGGCVYWRSLSSTPGDFACNYMLDTGEIRGCPAGKGCKRYNDDPVLKEKILQRSKNVNKWGFL